MATRDDERDRVSAQLAEFALGLLDPAEQSAVADAVSASPELADELAALRNTLALLDDSLEPLVPSAALRERVLAAATPGTRFEGFVARMARLFDITPERAREVLAAIGDPQADWEQPGRPGVRLFHFAGGPTVAGADCGLVELAPGVHFPAHRHHGEEWSLNLQGSAREDSGRVFEPGDLVRRGEGERHAFQATSDEPYVFAVVLYGGFHPEEDPDRTP